MKENMSLAELNFQCFNAVFNLIMRNIGNSPSCVAVIKTECAYPVMVGKLQQQAAITAGRSQNSKLLAKTNGLLTHYQKPAPSVKVYSERVWGLKISKKLMFDAENYALQALMEMALNIPVAKLYSDYVLDYYSNGEIKYRKVAPISCVNLFRHPPLSDWNIISLHQAQTMFPQMLKGLPNDLKAWKDTKVLMDKDARQLFFTFDERSDIYLPFNCVLHGNRIRYQGNFKLSGNLHSVFASFAKAVRNGNYDRLSDDLRTFEQVYYENGEPKSKKIRLLVGFADLPYQKALDMVCDADLAQLRQAAARGVQTFSLTANGELLDSQKVRTSRLFNSATEGEQIILAPQEVYESWGQEFSPQFLQTLGVKRKYEYLPGNNFLLNIAALPQKSIAASKQNSAELQRLLTLPSIGIKTVDGVDVVQLGQDIVAGKLTIAEACKKYNKLAALVEDMVETQYSCESAHYSTPERHSRLTGAYSGRVYSDRVIG